MFIEGFNNMPLQQQAGLGPSAKKEEAKLEEACQQFEEMFLNQMMSEMRKGAGSGGLGNSQQTKMFQGMMDQERAKMWAQEGGIGLSNMLFQQMKQSM